MRGKHLNSGIRGGLWEEEHLQRMGPAVWLFGWLVHRQTREYDGVGVVLGGSHLTYEVIRDDTGIAVRTLKRWMARLCRSGYVHVTHTCHKRMVIRISKAKKFGPQQLRFPQNSPTFPQAPFFAPNSKGPLLAPLTHSKGPTMAPMNCAKSQPSIAVSATCGHLTGTHREINLERHETNTGVTERSRGVNQQPSNPPLKRKPEENCAKTRVLGAPRTPLDAIFPPDLANGPPSSLAEFSEKIEQAVQSYYQRNVADRKLRRQAEVQAELRVGAGPEVRRETG